MLALANRLGYASKIFAVTANYFAFIVSKSILIDDREREIMFRYEEASAPKCSGQEIILREFHSPLNGENIFRGTIYFYFAFIERVCQCNRVEFHSSAKMFVMKAALKCSACMAPAIGYHRFMLISVRALILRVSFCYVAIMLFQPAERSIDGIVW